MLWENERLQIDDASMTKYNSIHMCTNIRLTDRKLVQTANVFFLLRQSYSHKILSEHEQKKNNNHKNCLNKFH